MGSAEKGTGGEGEKERELAKAALSVAELGKLIGIELPQGALTDSEFDVRQMPS